MSSADFQMRLRQYGPWLLFAAWLLFSALQLWVLEIEAIREGIFSCRNPATQPVLKGPQWMLDLLS